MDWVDRLAAELSLDVLSPHEKDHLLTASREVAHRIERKAHVELPRSPGWPQALDVLAAAGQGAKLRTGGLRAELFPTGAELGAFISACAERAVPFKCTAGLHHAV